MTYVLYHDNCPDGFAAAMVAWKAFNDAGLPNELVLMGVNYGQPVPSLVPDSEVFILDFSYPAEDLAELAKTALWVYVLDHHKTAEEDLKIDAFAKLGLVRPEAMPEEVGWLCPYPGIRIRFDMAKSGAVLAWEHFFPKQPVPLFLQYIQDRDLWTFKLPNSKAVAAYVQTLQREFALWEYTMQQMERKGIVEEIWSAGCACLRLKDQMVEAMAKHARLMLFDISKENLAILPATSPECFENQYFAPVANATVFYSEVGEKLLELYPNAKFAAYYMDRADGMRQWGLRSRPDFDCSVIAKAWGGGGHAQASGFIQSVHWPAR